MLASSGKKVTEPLSHCQYFRGGYLINIDLKAKRKNWYRINFKN
ncbi:hypothetical protein D1BOALGB6SA_5269 [Olavius sp. associated proteobacterium Delta 1]|nr:hypothetical protein D1BOALGB6SA_5269 [Olavius sp. associated proteobacterium Delta 1]